MNEPTANGAWGGFVSGCQRVLKKLPHGKHVEERRLHGGKHPEVPDSRTLTSIET